MAWSDHMASYTVWHQITPSNAVDLAEVTDGILVGGAGDIAAVMQNGAVVTLKNKPAGGGGGGAGRGAEGRRAARAGPGGVRAQPRPPHQCPRDDRHRPGGVVPASSKALRRRQVAESRGGRGGGSHDGRDGDGAVGSAGDAGGGPRGGATGRRGHSRGG